MMVEKHIYGEDEKPAAQATASNNLTLQLPSAFQTVVITCGIVIMLILGAILYQIHTLSKKMEEYSRVQTELLRDVADLKITDRKMKNMEVKQSEVKKILQHIEAEKDDKKAKK